MRVYEELKERGLVAQTTNEEKVKELLNSGKETFYIGFDPTADSLHVGSFVQIMVIAHLQRAGHVPVILFGGGTGMIGDPTGKTDMRRMMTKEEVEHNIACFKKQMASLLDFSQGNAVVVNNADWLNELNYVNFLREIGVHFSVNRMLAAECYKQRMERGLSLFELNYMVMQSYDYLILNKKYGCRIQIGGNDQWSNVIAGVDLIRRIDKKEVYGMTTNLLTTSDGRKMGKTENGAIWLDPKKTSPYQFYQYWRNVDDEEVIKLLKILTFVPLSQIKELEALTGSEINKAKEVLAFELTKTIHTKEEAIKARDSAKALFGGEPVAENMPCLKLSKAEFGDDILVTDLLARAGIVSSKSEARRLIDQRGLAIDGEIVEDINQELPGDDLAKGYVIIKKGKKNYFKVMIN